MLKILLIDLDGTLLGAHPKRLHWYFISSFVGSLRKLGIGFFKSLSILHQLKISVRKEEFQLNGMMNWDKTVVLFGQLTGLSHSESLKELSKISMQCFVHATPSLYALPEAQEFVFWAKNHYRLVLATNPLWPLAVVEYRLSVAGISPSEFEYITHAENMSSCKPNVHYYQELKSKLDLTPSECLMIGNDEKKDGPARDIGVEVVIINTPSDFQKLKMNLMNLEHNNGKQRIQ